MKKYLTMILALVMALSLVACGGSSSSGSSSSGSSDSSSSSSSSGSSASSSGETVVEPIVMTYGHVDPNVDGWQYTYAEDLNARITEATEGRVTLEIYPGETIGSSAEMTDMVNAGTLDMFTHTFATFDKYSDLVGVFNAPYAFTDLDNMVRASSNTSPVLQKVNEDLLANSNVRVVGACINGTRAISSKIEAYRPDDFKGHKFRCIGNDLWVAMVTGLGGVATPIENSEVPSSMMTGVIDATEQSIDGTYQNAYWEFADYLLLTEHDLFQNCIVANENSWQKISPEDQQIILDIFDEMAAEYAVKLVDNEAKQIAAIEEAGMIVIGEEDGLDVAAFRASVQKEIDKAFPQWSELIAEIQAL